MAEKRERDILRAGGVQQECRKTLIKVMDGLAGRLRT